MKEITAFPSIYMSFPDGARHKRLGFSPETWKNPWKKALYLFSLWEREKREQDL